jgi:hypothetical protein
MENIGTLTLIILILAAYRITRLIHTDTFPFGKLRLRVYGTWLGNLLSCPFCVSVWVGAFLAVGQGSVGDVWAWQVFIGAMALSAAVSLLAVLLPHSFD